MKSRKTFFEPRKQIALFPMKVGQRNILKSECSSSFTVEKIEYKEKLRPVRHAQNLIHDQLEDWISWTNDCVRCYSQTLCGVS